MGDPWLTIIGMPDDSAAHLPAASREALAKADVIFGGARHLELAGARDRGQSWQVPFSIDPVLSFRGQSVVVLASGDPFWFGVGGTLVSHLKPEEWTALPSPSTFSLVANALGWRLEDVTCHGLHAAPFARLLRVLRPYGRLICLVRNGDAPRELAEWLTDNEAGEAQLMVCEHMGGTGQRVRTTKAAYYALTDVQAPVAVAIELPDSAGLSRASGLPDDQFAHDGQITKRPVRALTLSALAPRPGEHLWDIGAGSGSVSVEWCLAGGRATAFDAKAERVQNVAQNITAFGIDHLMQVIEGTAPDVLADQASPNAVFVGGGGNDALFDALFRLLPKGTRLVANGVTLETEARLTRLSEEKGGNLLRIELAQAEPLGSLRGWQAARPVVQWSVTL